MRNKTFIVGFFSLLVALTIGAGVVAAQDGDGEGNPDNQKCLVCHEDSDATTTFENGDERPVLIDEHLLIDSVHGSSNPRGELACTDCHGEYFYPHDATYASDRDFRLQMNGACESCHTDKADLVTDSTHQAAMDAGNENAAVCVDCHGSHTVFAITDERARIPETCGQCHVAIYGAYKDSVHGEALLEEANPDVPTCINCHGVHNIENPTTALFRLKSPEICAQCHADEELMAKYGISTNVFDSYVADFHGTTVTLFANQAPDAEVNKAVCYDCHGVHDIRAPDDPESRVIHENLLATCQQCHPDAEANFPDAWLSHYDPDAEHNTLVYYVNEFYRVLIPGVVGFFGVVILTDIWRRITDRFTSPDSQQD